LEELQEADRIDWSRAALDSTHARGSEEVRKPAKTQLIRRKLGTKHHVVTDAQGIPLVVMIPRSNAHDANAIERENSMKNGDFFFNSHLGASLAP